MCHVMPFLRGTVLAFMLLECYFLNGSNDRCCDVNIPPSSSDIIDRDNPMKVFAKPLVDAPSMAVTC
jgi:hypothetical protein